MTATIKIGPHKITGEWIRVDNVESDNIVGIFVAMAVELNGGEWGADWWVYD